MADTSIEWTDKVWNATRGCSRISPGCGGAKGEGGCYAERQAARFCGPGGAYEGLVRVGKQGPRWTGKMMLAANKLADPLRWRKPQKIFVNSMSDLFHENLSNDDIAAVFGVMAACPQHTFQVLTKRASRMRNWFGWTDAPLIRIERCAVERGAPLKYGARHDWRWPLPNVHLGVSVEDQQRADERIPELLSTPAAVRFVSYEPALGPVDFSGCLLPAEGNAALNWVIVGGESGPGARPFDLCWARSVVLQCKTAEVACFVKQLGAKPYNTLGELFDFVEYDSPIRLKDRHGGYMAEWPEDLRIREFPRSAVETMR